MTNMKLMLVLTIIFAQVVLGTSFEQDKSGALTNDELKRYMEDVIAEYQVNLRKSALLQQPRRKRRSISMDDFYANTSTKGTNLF